MNELSLMTDSNIMLFDDNRFAQLEKISLAMSQGTVSIPKHLQQKPGDCLAVAMQAAQWGMNPFAVAQKTYFINHTISYEAQLVNAVVSSSKAIKGAFKYKYDGDWGKIAGTKPLTKAGWGDKEKGLCISVGAVLAGEEEITWGEPVYLSAVTVRNSPLWGTHVKQQMAYLGVNMWARMYTPAVILGVYTPEEVEARDITPTTAHDDTQKARLDTHKAKIKSAKQSEPIEGKSEEVKQEEPKSEPEAKPPTLAEFKKSLTDSFTPEAMKERKSEIGLMSKASKDKAIKLFTERLAVLKAPKEDKPEEEARPIDEAYRLMEIAKNKDDLDVAVDYVLSLNQGGKVTKEELNEFQIATDVKFDSFPKPE